MRYYVKNLLRKTIYTTLLISAGVIYGQYQQPIPIEAYWRGTDIVQETGYTEDERAALDALVDSFEEE